MQDTLQLASEGIPLKKIAALQEELGEVSQARSSTRKRRACKAVIREGEAILRASPSAPNRFRVLAIVLETKKNCWDWKTLREIARPYSRLAKNLSGPLMTMPNSAWKRTFFYPKGILLLRMLIWKNGPMFSARLLIVIGAPRRRRKVL